MLGRGGEARGGAARVRAAAAPVGGAPRRGAVCRAALAPSRAPRCVVRCAATTMRLASCACSCCGAL